jgi:hypothetical protein
MQTRYHIGLDVHMRTISDCVKDTGYGRRFSSSHRLRSGSMDENTSAAVDRGDGSHGVYDAVGHCAEKRRTYRREQDLRLPAL